MRRRNGDLVSQTPPVLGQDVQLTLDIELQRDLTETLRTRGENGAAVVLDVDTGDALALVSTPTYNLNTYRTYFAELARDPDTNLPLLNRALRGRYPPGSTVKPIAGLAAGAEGLINAHTVIECRGYLHVPTRFRCWIYRHGKAGHGPLDLRGALRHSCNIYFYKCGQWLGAERLGYWMRQFGLGAPTGTGLPEERGGRVPTRLWLWKNQERVFTPGDGRLMGIGQGLLEATPIQVANVMATIARNGKFLSTRLVVDDPTPQVERDLKLPAEALAAVRAGLCDVVNHPKGTAYRYARHSSAVICGKTGTATVWPLRIDSNHNDRIDSHDQVVKEGAMSWFAGYAPRDNPRIAFAILLEYADGASGGRDCGPLAVLLVDSCLRRGYLDR